MMERRAIVDYDNCPYVFPHWFCDNPCKTPPEPRYLSSRPEEMASEDVMRELGIYYERPIEEEENYHVKRPDFYFFIPGLDVQALDDKNRNHSRYQNPDEVKREFVKDTPFPLHIVGSFNLTRPGQMEFLRDTAAGSSLHDFGFKYEENPVGFKAKLRDFFTTQLEKGKKILEDGVRALRFVESGAAPSESTVGRDHTPELPGRSNSYDWLCSSLKETMERDRRGLCLTVQLDAMSSAIENGQMRRTLHPPQREDYKLGDFAYVETTIF